MAFTRVQATPVIQASAATTLNVVFASPPTVGNAVVMAFVKLTTAATTNVTDNKGNSYTLAKAQINSGSGAGLDIWYCSAITATGASFTVTATGTSVARSGLAIEVNPALAVDQTVSLDSSGTTGSPGTTAATTGADAFLVTAITTGSSTIVVGVVSPVWTQEMDTAGTSAAGEIDSRALTGSVGTTQTASWTLNGANFYGAALVAFKAGAAPGGAATTQTILLLT